MIDEQELSEEKKLEMQIYSFAVYCEDREAFALTIQRISSLIGILSGTALVAVARNYEPFISITLGFATALLSGLILVFDFSGIASRHRELRRQLVNIGYKLEANEITTGAARAEYNKMYGDTPIIFHAVSAYSYNIIQEKEDRKTRISMKWHEILLRNFRRYHAARFINFVEVETKKDKNPI